MKKITPTVEQQAVLDCEKDMIITACPGSGKTAVIAEKVRQILPSLPEYKGIAAISYTRKASTELKKRCSFDGIDTKRSFFGTIDSFCISEILMPFLGHIFGKTPNQVEVRFFNNLNDEDKASFDDISINEVEIEQIDLLKDRLKFFYLRGVILMETVGILSVFVLDKSKACQRYIKSRYAAIFIDEYQDSGNPQHELFLRFRLFGIFSVAVGDVDQSIFAFSHRDPKYLKLLCAKDSGYENLKLTINHRCHPSIVNYANRLLNEKCPLLPLVPVDDIRVYRREITGTQIEVVEWINQHLPAIKKSFGVEHNREIGILVRNSNTGVIVANNLNTPLRLFNDNDLTRTPNLSSNIFASLLNFRFDKNITAQSIIEDFLQRRVKREHLFALRKSISECRNCEIDAFATSACLVASYLLGAEVSKDSISKLNTVLANSDDLKFFEPINEDEVQVMTLHKSKGLEFKVVFHLDLYDWVLPRRVFMQGNYDVIFENEQECLNLHYVGVTRAQAACILLTSTKRLNFSNEIRNANPSQFYSKVGLANQFK